MGTAEQDDDAREVATMAEVDILAAMTDGALEAKTRKVIESWSKEYAQFARAVETAESEGLLPKRSRENQTRLPNVIASRTYRAFRSGSPVTESQLRRELQDAITDLRARRDVLQQVIGFRADQKS